jgi:hypothetical protein
MLGGTMKMGRSLLLLVISMPVGCQDAQKTTEPRILDEDVGERIPLDVAERWKALYDESPSEGSDGSAPYGATASQLAAVLRAAPDRLGVALHHGLDDDGKHHVLITAVGRDAESWGSGVVLDANTDGTVDESTAREWAARYEEANPEQVWYHFFGRSIFDEITSNLSFEYLDVRPAVNELGEPQLLLMVWNAEDAVQSRSRDGDPVPYDASSPCPPCGVE